MMLYIRTADLINLNHGQKNWTYWDWKMIIKIQCHHKKKRRPIWVDKADANETKQKLNELLKLRTLENTYQSNDKDVSCLDNYGTRTLS